MANLRKKSVGEQARGNSLGAETEHKRAIMQMRRPQEGLIARRERNVEVKTSCE